VIKTNLTARARAESDANMCAITVDVNDRLHHHYGRSPKRNPALQAVIAVSTTHDDRVALARAIGRTELFEAAIEPAL
jgi:hypothetical protein